MSHWYHHSYKSGINDEVSTLMSKIGQMKTFLNQFKTTNQTQISSTLKALFKIPDFHGTFYNNLLKFQSEMNHIKMSVHRKPRTNVDSFHLIHPSV